MTITIADRQIGLGFPPFVIAEMSGNHNQSLDRAMAIVEAAARSGAHGLKLQTYTADTMTLDIDRAGFRIDDRENLWSGRTLHSLYRDAYTPWEWHGPLLDRAKELGLVAFSTPFDASSVDFLESLDVPCYKIASFENTDIPLIRRVAATGKPLIMSTGMASLSELGEAVDAARSAGCKELVLLKCTSTYPASPDCSNIRTLPHMRELFDCEVGLSDHTMGCGAAVAAVAMGAVMVEKHFTVARADGGVDAAFSMEPEELRLLVTESERAWRSLGRVVYGVQSEQEARSLAFRRSLYAAADISQGALLTSENVRAIRPGFGLPPKFLDVVLGRRAKVNIAEGTPINWDLLG